MGRATWFCVDIECSGPVPARYDMISLGAIVVTDHVDRLELGASYYVEIVPTAPHVSASAMAVNKLDLERIRREGKPLPDALAELTAFVKAHTAPGSKPVFVGHNAPFDWSFVSYSYDACGLPNPFGYKALDTKALAAGVLGLHWFDTDKERLQQLLELPPQDEALVHRADYDAAYQAKILIGLLAHQRGNR